MRDANIFLLGLVFLTSHFSVRAQYTISSNADGVTCAISGYSGQGGAVNIPSTVNGLTVVSIGTLAFSSQNSLTSVTIPASVTNIGKSAFSDCGALTSVIIPGSVTSIGNVAFRLCSSLSEIYFTGNPPALGSNVFFEDAIATVYYFPCIYFYNCPSSWGPAFGELPTAEATFAFTVENTGLTITGYFGPGGMVTIPGTIGGSAVTAIGGYAFDEDNGNSSLTSVTIPDSVTNIEDSAFQQAYGLSNISIGSGVLSIGASAFEYCFLTSIAIPASVTNLGPYMFVGCPLSLIMLDPQNAFYSSTNGILFNKSQSILVQAPPAWPVGEYTIPSSVTSIQAGAFEGCGNLTNVTIPDTVTNIGDSAFSGSGLQTVTVPNSIGCIAGSEFSSCGGLTNVVFGNHVTSIGDWAFYACPLSSVIIPNIVTNIGAFAFDDCGNLSNVVFGSSLVSIGQTAFYDCAKLTSIVIPDSVTNLAGSSFYLCESLSNVIIGAGVTSLQPYTFRFCGMISIFFRGDAPTADSSVFQYETPTAYYLPGTTGWGSFSTNTGLSTVMWNPSIQTGNKDFGIQNNQFEFSVVGSGSLPIAVQACTNLANPIWIALTNATLTNGSYFFSDLQWTNHTARFYSIAFP